MLGKCDSVVGGHAYLCGVVWITIIEDHFSCRLIDRSLVIWAAVS